MAIYNIKLNIVKNNSQLKHVNYIHDHLVTRAISITWIAIASHEKEKWSARGMTSSSFGVTIVTPDHFVNSLWSCTKPLVDVQTVPDQNYSRTVSFSKVKIKIRLSF